MLDKIIKFSIYNKLIIGVFIFFLIFWGIYSLKHLPIDAVPDITDNQVMIITASPRLAAQEVEQLVTFPVEQTMIDIPGIDNLRSFSRFGLSIVTVVFKENIDLYWARQQVQERLTLAEKEIPSGVGTPEMMPVTTGLGEIYQYVVHTSPGYEDKYTVTDLRTIQDWIIKRQLLGTPGVAEVSAMGGYVKQYEISVSPDELLSLNISISDIFTALEKNNQNTGGAYIDKTPNAYFIRTEGLVKNIEDIKKIVVRGGDSGNAPVLIEDVAEVGFGHSTRYGAATRNGKGEVVTGIVLMLKGANSSEVINNVKEKIEQIRTTLPKGVTIEPYLDRKKLVDKAIGTVTKNLAEGALIVIFVLIIFLGNLRGGLVVASVIPLAMLFAISMMQLFGISGNLMSLGAIDFGLIVDGTVIIVEAVSHGIVNSRSRYNGKRKLTQSQMDNEVYHSAGKIRTSAAFGEIIILIVYFPIWTLTGVAGKMFVPMAQTVSFAILGAFILSLTYVPMMSALALSRKTEYKRNFSDKMMDFFQRIYNPIINKAIANKLAVIIFSLALLIITIVVFMRMGGEFIPQLDEGDFAVETRVPMGSSLQHSIDVSLKAQEILLKFPEVEQVVSKIGSGEVPTDPMPIEAGDMMVVLKPRNQWVTANNREELAKKMQEALEVIPLANFGFQQPIQMRFNELLTGAKQDVVIKIYGENLNTLSMLAKKVSSTIKNVEGVVDLYVEEITGLPQINIKLDRDRIAQYGMNVEDISNIIETAYAGKSAGLVFEGERRFDLTVRLKKQFRTDISDIRLLYVPSASGQQIPLSEVAHISFEQGPVQIQRDNAKRRVIVGFNVRNRDVRSIVADIRQMIDNQVDLPSGYYATYGGQFRNLQQASSRLAVVLPIALFLILLLLYLTFGSIKQSLLIFTAIPFSAIGGVFALFLRDLPFSISAGVGFIALFGVSVLNGIVLIAEFNSLEKSGITDIYQRVLEGTKHRLRPVLMTATVASWGFLPMALSSSSGAEVQRPLATVVIGGLISATILTLVVLPVLYIYFSNNKQKNKNKMNVKSLGIVSFFIPFMGLFLFSNVILGQNTDTISKLTMPQAIAQALENSNLMKIEDFKIQKQQRLQRGVFQAPKTEFSYSQGRLDGPDNIDNAFSVTQQINFPYLYISRYNLGKIEMNISNQNKIIGKNELIAKIKKVYVNYNYLRQQEKLLLQQDSIYELLEKVSQKRYKIGETTSLENVTSTTKSLMMKNKLSQLRADITLTYRQLEELINSKNAVELITGDFFANILSLELFDSIGESPEQKYWELVCQQQEQIRKVELSKMLPDFSVTYNSQTFRGDASSDNRFSSFSVGISVPIFTGDLRANTTVSKINTEIAKVQLEQVQLQITRRAAQLLSRYHQCQKNDFYYRTQALPRAEKIINNSQKSFENGDISYFQHLQNLDMAILIKTEYLDNVLKNNFTVIELEKLSGSYK